MRFIIFYFIFCPANPRICGDHGDCHHRAGSSLGPRVFARRTRPVYIPLCPLSLHPPQCRVPPSPSPASETSSQVSPLPPAPPRTRSPPPEMSIAQASDPALRPRDPHFRIHHPPPSPPPSSSSSESATRNPPSYSFNVLRADPVTASLEHVASSTTLRPRAASASSPSHPGMHGAAPVFRVAMSPPEPRPSRHRPPRPVREILPDTRDRHHARDGLSPSIPREADLAHLRSPTSAILSFPVSDHPVSTSSALITTDGRRVHLRSEIPGAALQGEGRGKKHQCPHCGKRFNRPSSMKIHVNTHTGAKRTWRFFFYFITQRVRRFTTLALSLFCPPRVV